MQRLRSTFKRSRTPTGAEMKSQSSLEVPKQVRSASFDEIQLEAKRQDMRGDTSSSSPANCELRSARTTSSSSSSCSPARGGPGGKRSAAAAAATLKVPMLHGGQRSKSFDVYDASSRAEYRRMAADRQRSVRRSPPDAPSIQLSGCYHCACLEEYQAIARNLRPRRGSRFARDDANDTEDENQRDSDEEEAAGEEEAQEEEEEEEEEEELDYESDIESSYYSPRDGSPEIRVTLTVPRREPEERRAASAAPRMTFELDSSAETSAEELPRRRSIASPKLSRQKALTSFPLELPAALGSSRENESKSLEDEPEEVRPRRRRRRRKRGDDRAREEFDDEDDDDDDDDEEEMEEEEEEEEEEKAEGDGKGVVGGKSAGKLVVRDIFLTVPELKRDRAASVDSCFDSNKNGKKEQGGGLLAVPQQSARSKSVDIVLPTDAQTRYTTLLPGSASERSDRISRGGRQEGGTSGGQREPRSTPDWGPTAINGEHLWVPTAASGDFCYVNDCSKHGPRMKCAACRVVAHACCASTLSFACKSSFRDVGVRQYREQTTTHHHWVHRRSQKGKCANCAKSFQSKLSFTSKEIVAVSCSWCKKAYHNKEACFDAQRIGEKCELGIHGSIVVPPAWIVKLPRKGSFKSSLRKSPRKKKAAGTGKKAKEKDKELDKDHGRLWVVKPIPTAGIKPVLVFINPKSGGNQGAKLLQKFQWLLNPRQVFDLTQGGPKMGLELFKKVPNLRVLACGGDGTVGWVLSILDQIGADPPPAVGVLPLGTGNDLARALGWGGGYTDEPIGKILTNIGESDTTLLDRWQLQVERNPDAQNDEDAGKGKDNLPLNVVNNYFSLGVDAYIALEFHEAREAHPEKFNSRLRNKMYYGQMGGKDLVRRKWKDLSEFVTLECDGQDMTAKLKEHRVHAIVFLNIASYGGGTHPWGAGSGTREPSTDDGFIEVVGLTTYQLPLLQAGGHGTCIAQCSTAKLVTTRTIPMQVDGEACRLLPSVINMSLLNKATMLAKRRNASKSQPDVAKLERLKLPVMRIKMSDYETYHSDKDKLKSAATMWLPDPLDLDATTDLESLRNILAKDRNMDTCCFLDSCTAERFFRVDRAQEQLHYVTDVAVEAVYVLDEAAAGRTSAEPETARASPSEDRPRASRAVTQEKPADEEPEAPRENPSAEKPEKPAEKSIDRSAGESAAGEKAPPSASKDEPARQSSRKSQVSESRRKETSSIGDQRSAQKESSLKHSSSSKSASEAINNQPHQSHQATPTFISPRDRLFGLGSEVHTFSTGLLERTSDGILRAAKLGDLQAMKDLHAKGYSLLSIDSSGQTALHLASRHGHKDIVRYLIACAPSTVLNMVDNDKGQTALHKAAQQKRRTICCMLVAGGAALTVKDRHGNTPRQLALMAEDRELAAYLHSQEQFQLETEEGDTAL